MARGAKFDPLLSIALESKTKELPMASLSCWAWSKIDEALSEVMAQICNDNSECRPDIALCHEEGSVVTVELTRPGVSIDEHKNELFK